MSTRALPYLSVRRPALVGVREFLDPTSWRSFMHNLAASPPREPWDASMHRALRDVTHPSAGIGEGALGGMKEGPYQLALHGHEAYSRSFDHPDD